MTENTNKIKDNNIDIFIDAVNILEKITLLQNVLRIHSVELKAVNENIYYYYESHNNTKLKIITDLLAERVNLLANDCHSLNDGLFKTKSTIEDFVKEYLFHK